MRVVAGRHEGETGLIVRIEANLAVLLSDLTLHEVRDLCYTVSNCATWGYSAHPLSYAPHTPYYSKNSNKGLFPLFSLLFIYIYIYACSWCALFVNYHVLRRCSAVVCVYLLLFCWGFFMCMVSLNAYMWCASNRTCTHIGLQRCRGESCLEREREREQQSSAISQTT